MRGRKGMRKGIYESCSCHKQIGVYLWYLNSAAEVIDITKWLICHKPLPYVQGIFASLVKGIINIHAQIRNLFINKWSYKALDFWTATIKWKLPSRLLESAPLITTCISSSNSILLAKFTSVTHDPLLYIKINFTIHLRVLLLIEHHSVHFTLWSFEKLTHFFKKVKKLNYLLGLETDHTHTLIRTHTHKHCFCSQK